MLEFNRDLFEQAIKASGMDIAVIASQAGRSPFCLYKILDGTRKDPSGSTVHSIAAAIKADARAFYVEVPDAE